MAYINHTLNISKRSNTIWYVDKGDGSDSNSGLTPENAFETIGAAITACSAGDTIKVAAGTYTETGLDLDENSVSLQCDLGTILDPASGDCLTISGNYCSVIGVNGAIRINNDAGANSGVVITGNWAYLDEIRVACGSTGDHGFDIQGDGCDLRRCRASNIAAGGYAFRIQGDTNKLENCCTGGNAASYGFYVDSTADKFRLKGCGSQGHSAAGFYIEDGATNGCIDDCYSGGGDGKWRDLGNETIFSQFEYDETLHSDITYADGVTLYNIFQITGSVLIKRLYGVVTDALVSGGASSTLKLILDDANEDNPVDVTDVTGNTNGFMVGAVFMKIGDSGDALLTANPNGQPYILENTNFRSPDVPFAAVEASDADTHIKALLSADPTATADGTIRWYCQWEPLSEDGNVTQVTP